MKFVTLSFLFVGILLSACSTKQTISCINDRAGVVITGYNSTETNSILVLHYLGTGQFDSLIRADTLIAGTYANQFEGGIVKLQAIFGDTFDIEVRIPATGNIYRISDIVYELPRQEIIRVPFGAKIDPVPCFNHLISYSLDGVRYIWPQGQQFLTISK